MNAIYWFKENLKYHGIKHALYSLLIKPIFELIIKILDKDPNRCWAELVMWTINGDFEHIELSKNQICKKWKKETPYAYCNKCELNGNYYKEEAKK